MGDDKGTFELSRRKALAGLGTIGIASAGAGLGTSAYFNDTESFNDNSVTAGELDLAVQATVYEYQGEANGNGETFGGDGTLVQDGQSDPTIKQEISDVKPGDYSWGKFCFSIVDNPAYVWMNGALTANHENTVTEPEAEDEAADDSSGGLTGPIANPNTTPSSTSITGEGELADNVKVWIGYGSSGLDLSNQDRPSAGSPDGSIAQGTLADVLNNQIGGGQSLDSTDGDSGTTAFTGSDSQSFDDDRCVVFAWEVPTSVDNRIQSDSVNFDIEFAAVQERHNDNSANPFN